MKSASAKRKTSSVPEEAWLTLKVQMLFASLVGVENADQAPSV